MLRHFYDATWGRKPLRRGRASGKQTYSGPLGKADRNGAFSPYGTGNERERGIVSAPLRKTNRERVQGERLYVTIYYVLIKRKKTIRGPMRSKQERTSKPPPPPLQPSLKGEGWSLGMREGSFQEDMADVANESTAGTAGGERAAVLALRADGEESELRDAAGTGSGGVHGGVALGHPGGAGYGTGDGDRDRHRGALSEDHGPGYQCGRFFRSGFLPAVRVPAARQRPVVAGYARGSTGDWPRQDGLRRVGSQRCQHRARRLGHVVRLVARAHGPELHAARHQLHRSAGKSPSVSLWACSSPPRCTT